MTAEDRAALSAAGDAYNSNGKGFAKLGVAFNPQDGLQANVTFDHRIGKYILAFRGTDQLVDWVSNFKHAFGLGSSQHAQAKLLATDVHMATGGNVIFAGHSLGGSLASVAADATGGNAITFNASGMNYFSRSGNSGNVRAHYIRGDLLNVFQDFTFLPNTLGERIPHTGRQGGGFLRRHDLDQF